MGATHTLATVKAHKENRMFRKFNNFLFRFPVFFDADPAGGGGGTGTNTPAPKTFTQEQLDSIIAGRLTEKERTTQEKVLKDLGIDSVENGKKALEAWKKAEEEKKTAEERTQTQIKTLTDEKTKFQQERDEALVKLKERELKSAIKDAAAAAGFRPEAQDDVFLVIDRSKIVEKDGTYTGIKEAVEAVSKAKPHWMAEGDKTKPKGTPPGAPPKPKDPAKPTDPPQQIVRL